MSSFEEMRAKLAAQWSPEMESRTNQTLRAATEPAADQEYDFSGPEARFELQDTEGWLTHLDQQGFVVLGGLFTDQEVERAKSLLWEFLETQGMRNNDPSTWVDHFPGDKNTGICPTVGAPHSDFAWFVRSHPSVSEVFSNVWEVPPEELISSFDAINVFRPFVQAPGLKTRGGWLHLDQNAYPAGRGKSGKHCVQGLVTILDAGPNTGSLVVVPRSQLRHEELCERARCATGDFVPLQHNGVPLDTIFQGSRPTVVCATGGEMILWDSRTVHANVPAAADTTHSADELLRMVCYTCLTPRAWASDMCIRERQRAYECAVGGTHWPHEFKARGVCGEPVKSLLDASEEIQLLVGRAPPPSRPSDEAMAAMEKANEFEAEGDLGAAKKWLDEAVKLGHNCLAEYGGWK